MARLPAVNSDGIFHVHISGDQPEAAELQSHLEALRATNTDHHKADQPVFNPELTTAGRKRISPKNFALPGRRYPIEDAAHARNALARVAQHGSPSEQKRVRAAVHRKYPGIGKS